MNTQLTRKRLALEMLIERIRTNGNIERAIKLCEYYNCTKEEIERAKNGII